ncbi:EF-hand calcium-binding domain-containing protein 10 like protein [Aduncisulcus paluster]|uniref:EF-hand calcium-binding domain-containing protein 10 like protein n=1 Tax=Aduncisulcus paluster TaxID=2918883 RepID=A0ABQ5KTX5_9EUKA|nr:EF-hand calcium-binding domain-containing protein 10 like protein [Aduncisulcus paluster]
MSAEEQKALAKKYLTDRNVSTLFETLTSLLVLKKPEDHIRFLQLAIEDLKKSDVKAMIELYDESDLSVLFGRLDILKKGTITYSDLKRACLRLNVLRDDFPSKDEIPAEIDEAFFCKFVGDLL